MRGRVILGGAVVGLLLLAGWWFMGGGAEDPAGPGRPAGREEAAPRRAPAFTLDPSVLRLGSRYGSKGPSHAKLDLSLKVVRLEDGVPQPAEGATLVIDDAPVGVSDAQGLLTVEVAISDAGEARHVVWAEAGDQRSASIAFDEAQWPAEALTFLLTGVGRIEGQVLGVDGKPVEGASLALDPPVAAPTNTDLEGRFRFEGLAPGRMELEAWRDGKGVRVPVQVVSGRSTRLVLRLSSLGTIEGVVVDESGAPVADASVRLVERATESPLTQSKTDAAGSFDFGPTFLEWGWVFASKEGARGNGHVGTPYDAMRIVLRRTGSVAGRVLDARGQPVRGASVLDHNPRILTGDTVGAAQAMGEEARYRLAAVSNEVKELFVSAPGQAVYQKIGGLEVVPGEEVIFDLTLEPRGRSLTGRVRDQASGQGIADVELELTASKGGMAFDDTKTFVHTDARGEFQVAATDADSFIVAASHPRYRPYRNVLSSQALQLEMVPGRRVSGQVVDERFVPITKFRLMDREVSDTFGRFDEAIDLATHELEIAADGYRPKSIMLGEGDPLELGRILLEDAGWVTAVVRTHDDRPAVGATVYRFDSEWVQDIQTNRSAIGYGILPVAVTDENGRAEVAGLGERGCLAALLEGHGPSLSPPCGRPSEGGKEVLLWLLPEAIVEGSAGRAGRRVSVGPEGAQTLADETGHYRVGGLGSGAHKVSFRGVTDEERLYADRPVELRAGETTRLDLEDLARGAVRVTLRGDTDELIILMAYPIASAPDPESPPSVTTNRAAIFQGLHGEVTREIDGLVPGPTRVMAMVREAMRHVDTEVVAGETAMVSLEVPRLSP